MGQRLGHPQAYAVASYLSDTPLFLVIDSSSKARQEALHRFRAQPQAVSFTDYIVMAVADEYETKTIFGFDDDYDRAGYQIIGKAGGLKTA
jgi:predicted nucleic acid-binding protein